MSDDERSSSPTGEKYDAPQPVVDDGESDDDLPAAGRKRPRTIDPDEEDAEDVNGNENEEKEDDEKDGEDKADVDDDEDDEEDEEDDDDDEDEEDEEEGGRKDGERKKKRRRKNKTNRFLELEAEVDDEDEEEDEADDYGDVAEFIEEHPEDAGVTDDRTHRRLDRAFGENEQASVEDIVQRLKERHGRMAAARYNAESDQVPQRLLMPGVNDPKLWIIRVKTGREDKIIASIFRKVFAQQFSANPIDVLSVFYRDSLPGMIFVEAHHSASVSQAVSGIVGVFGSKPPQLVPVEEMAPLLKIKKKEVNLTPGMWVRLKRGKYQGDLAQVTEVDQLTNGVVEVKFLPRIDLTPREKRRERAAGGKGLGIAQRPPAAPFQYDEVRKIYGRSSVKMGQNGYIFDGDEYHEGFCYKSLRINLVQTENINPTLEEVSKFSGDEKDTTKLDLSAIADANRQVSASILVPGDKVEVHEGEQTGLIGIIVGVMADTVSIRAEGGEIHGQTVEVSSSSVRKRFDIGEHVKVLHGKNADVTGMVVEVKGEIVTLMSDQNEREIQVFSKDIRQAADRGDSTTKSGMYDLHDMIMLDSTTAAVIYKIEGDVLRVLDQNGTVRTVSPQQVTLRRENKEFAVATDSQNNEMRVGDAMKETEGENRQGEILNIFRSIFVFLHNREMTENNGVWVARAQNLQFVTPKTAANDLSKMNPTLNAQLPYGGASLMPPPMANVNKNRLVNTLVVVVKGTSKGLMGIIKDVQGANARVELATNNKTLTINMASLKRKDPKTGATYPLEYGGGSYGNASGRPPMGAYDINPYGGAPMNGGATPGFANGGRTPGARFGQTPNPYAPGGAMGGKTPNPYAAAAGGRTPAPGFAAGGKTPGWAGVSGGKTPAPGFNAGGKTPGWAGVGGGKTPNPYAAGGRTPAPAGSMYAPPEASSSRYGATPYTAPTPAVTAPTPAASHPYGAPTPSPYGGAPTPYGGPTPYGAPTPGIGLSAPTPGIQGAPTPYATGTPFGAPTPFAPGVDPTSSSGLAWDWVLDFRNVIVEVGPSSRPGTRNPLHYQRGAYDGKKFGYDAPTDESARCVLLDDPSVEETIPVEYLRPAKPDGAGQSVVVVSSTVGGSDMRGQQRVTLYEDSGSWMMEQDAGDVGPLVLDGAAATLTAPPPPPLGVVCTSTVWQSPLLRRGTEHGFHYFAGVPTIRLWLPSAHEQLVTITARPGHAETVKSHLARVQIHVAEAERGTKQYQVTRDVEDERVFLIWEEFADEAAAKAHLDSGPAKALAAAAEVILESLTFARLNTC